MVEKFEPVTLSHIHGHGCRDILIYCGSINCSHSATMNADHWPDDTVVRTLGPKDDLHEVQPPRRRRAAGLVAARQ